MTMNPRRQRLIINNHSDFDLAEILPYMMSVINNVRISKNGKIYATTFHHSDGISLVIYASRSVNSTNTTTLSVWSEK